MVETIKSIFDTDEFMKYKARWVERRRILSLRKSYYDGSIYRASVFSKENQTILGTNAYGLYKHMRPLYLPLARAVDIDAGIIPANWSLVEDIPNYDDIKNAKDTLFDISRWDTEGVLFVHYGAQYGLTGLKVCNIPDGLAIETIDPMTFLLVNDAVIIAEERTDEDEKKYEYGEVITAETVRTFKNGVPFAFEDESSEKKYEWKNPIGVVPVVEAKHMETGEKYGEATYSKTIPMLSELNGLASYLADIVKKHAEPQWAVFGSEPSDLAKSGDNVWYFPTINSDAKALVAAVDVSGVLEFVREVRDQVHASLPELSFDELRKKDQVATATVELQLMELVLKVKRCRPNYDQCLADALRIAGIAADKIGVSQFSILNDSAIEFDQNRPILPVDPKLAMELEMQALELEQMKRGLDSRESINVNA